MRAFAYQQVSTLDDAINAAGQPDTMLVAGGTNVVDLMRQGVYRPAVLIDISRLEMNRIEPTSGGGWLIGAGVRNTDLAAHPEIRSEYPLLSEALLSGASGQIRNLATVAGNLLQRTRCGYFSDVTKPCNKREPGSGCPAIAGAHRELAVIGHSDSCIATHPSDMAVALAALEATVHIRGFDGERQVLLADLYRLPGEDPTRDTTLAAGEIITAVELPPAAAGRQQYRKVRDRASFAFALISVAADVSVVDGVIERARLAFGGVAPKPWRALTAEQEMVGRPATAETFRSAMDAEFAAAQPLPENSFKIPLASRTAVSVLLGLVGHEVGTAPEVDSAKIEGDIR